MFGERESVRDRNHRRAHVVDPLIATPARWQENSMRVLPRVLLGTAAVGLALALVPVAAGADSNGNDQPLLRSGIVGSTPVASGGVVLSGVTPGGVPWVVGSGRVKVDRDGSLDLRVQGLVVPVPPFNGTNPVAAVSASLVCNGVPGTPTATVAMTPAGDARIRATVAVPTPCLAPGVLVNPGGNGAVYIAANG
jgi:hypothetical protein